MRMNDQRLMKKVIQVETNRTKSYTSGNQKEVQQSVDLVDYVRSLSLGWLGHVIRTDYQILTKFIQVETNRK